MSSKHFFNDPTQLLASCLQSVARCNPSVAADVEGKTIYLKKRRNSHVSVIAGGGSGHEPSFVGMVGHGFLSAAVVGSIFASPSADQVYRCLMQRVNRDQGILIIIMNYTGDKLHFGMAVEKARANGVRTELLVVCDDVGVGRSKAGRIGRRGLAGTLLVQKVAGAAAAAGRSASFEEVYKTASLAAENVATVGASLAHVHIPGRVVVPDEMNTSDDVEIGMGIHNEEGFGRVKTSLPDLIETMLVQLLDTTDQERAFIDIQPSDPIVLLINNLGGLSVLELGGITNEVCLQLQGRFNLNVKRVLSGTYMSSLNGMGFSISLLKLCDTGLGPGKSMLDLVDAPVEANGWGPVIQPDTWEAKYEIEEGQPKEIMGDTKTMDIKRAVQILRAGLNRLIAAEPEVTRYDTLVGDGDCGLCLKTGAEAVLQHLNQGQLSDDAALFVTDLAHVVETHMDGTSGAIYSIFLNSLTNSLREDAHHITGKVDVHTWATALQSALQALGNYTPAKPGDRTLVDALQPFVEALAASKDVEQAIIACRKGYESTKGMEAQLGRSVYVGGTDWRTCPDPGAFGLYELLAGICGAL
ncbi:hypothetical protein PENARI_c040G10714 [Penicillium arizonense]|uniref:Dihydroxyacetone kinase n=1 Tax=Penicillium arizonense TaxID=1835702 RepID=A0A1F5L317_PENAI|nr:hypothetical protein PENARI_c040G10714 [Penicillium arizonense]OGE47613.1 hypothetical protein PENARI_c040G10714 [Penicillium arizonense]